MGFAESKRGLASSYNTKPGTVDETVPGFFCLFKRFSKEFFYIVRFQNALFVEAASGAKAFAHFSFRAENPPLNS